jgi:alkylation response protein AidB-like acyl-CoA dehydrogenase
MNFDLDEDQRLLKASVERFAADRYGGDIERRRRYRAEPAGFSADNWRALAELGLLALPVSTSGGGLGGGPVDLIVASEALGAGLVVEPWLDAVVVAGGLIDRAGTAAQREHWLPRLTTGGGRLALAHAERAARYELDVVNTLAQPRPGGGYGLSGGKTFVLHGVGADAYLVSARDESGVGFFLVPADAKGVEARRYTLADGSPAQELVLHGVLVPAEARLAGGMAAFAEVVAVASLAASAEMLGLMKLLFDATLAYAKTRQQFGAPIGSFQVLQHRLVDAYASVEQARSMLYRAVLAPPGEAWRRQAAGAKAFIAEAALAVGHTAVQIHGGMGMTDELMVGHAHKRILVLWSLFGDPAAQLRRYRQAA